MEGGGVPYPPYAQTVLSLPPTKYTPSFKDMCPKEGEGGEKTVVWRRNNKKSGLLVKCTEYKPGRHWKTRDKYMIYYFKIMFIRVNNRKIVRYVFVCNEKRKRLMINNVSQCIYIST